MNRIEQYSYQGGYHRFSKRSPNIHISLHNEKLHRDGPNQFSKRKRSETSNQQTFDEWFRKDRAGQLQKQTDEAKRTGGYHRLDGNHKRALLPNDPLAPTPWGRKQVEQANHAGKSPRLRRRAIKWAQQKSPHVHVEPGSQHIDRQLWLERQKKKVHKRSALKMGPQPAHHVNVEPASQYIDRQKWLERQRRAHQKGPGSKPPKPHFIKRGLFTAKDPFGSFSSSMIKAQWKQAQKWDEYSRNFRRKGANHGGRYGRYPSSKEIFSQSSQEMTRAHHAKDAKYAQWVAKFKPAPPKGPTKDKTSGSASLSVQ